MENNNQDMTAQAPSESLKDIIVALCGFQSELQNPKKDVANEYFKSKYVDLAGVWDACRPLLTKYGLCLVQNPSAMGNVITVTGTLYHTSGQRIVSVLTATAKDALPQSVGSAITYLRRYQMCAILGVAAEDDDGNAANGNEKPVKEKTLAQQKGPFSHGIPKAQHDAELAAKDAMPPAPAGQQDRAPFRDKVKSGGILKTGKTGTGAPWTLYQIEFEGHGTETTFHKSVCDQAKAAKAGDFEVMVHFEPTKNGPAICEIELIETEAPVNGKKVA